MIPKDITDSVEETSIQVILPSQETQSSEPEVETENIKATSVQSNLKSKLDRTDNWLMSGIKYLLDKQLHFLVLLAAVVYLAYSWYSTQDKYAHIQAYNFEGKLVQSVGKTEFQFYRDSGSSRPVFTTLTNDTLLEFADWASNISVNGQNRSLWETYHNYSNDPKNHKFYHSMSFGDWTLFQEITLGPQPNRALVEYYYRQNNQVSNVVLQLGHFQYHFISPKLGSYGFEAQLNGNPITPENEREANPRFKINLQVNLPAYSEGVVPVKVENAGKNKYGTINIVTTYTLANIPVNTRTLLASEELTWEELPH